MIADFISSGLSQALAFTLLHSLWEGLIVFTLTTFLLSLISKRNSSARYLITTGGLFVFVIIVIVTFVAHMPSTQAVQQIPAITFHYLSAVTAVESSEWTARIGGFINGRSVLISMLWFTGAICFLLRTVTGWAYLNTITSNSRDVDQLWRQRIQEIAKSLAIKRTVRLIESALVNSPIVVGVIKPAIVIPIGLASGLTVEQVEAIFVHELIHIKRHDYLVNIVQCVIESIFFFNPFVWMLSRSIRKEREHCCDDAVITYGTNPRCYVMALASLEETRVAGNNLALSVSGNKNELLNRIKRLMEKSVQNYSLRDRMIPVTLLIVGFICASWFTIQRGDDPSYQLRSDDKIVVSDTTKKNKKNRMKEQHEEAREQENEVELFSHDESHDLFDVPPSPDMIPTIPPFDIPEFSFDVTGFELEIPEFDHEVFGPDMHIFMDKFDSLPRIGDRDWNAFEEEFRTKFQERFKDFYSKNEKEIEKMLEEMEKNHFGGFNESRLAELQARSEESQRFMEDHHERLMEQQMHMKDMEHKMKEWEEKHARQMQAMEENLKEFESNMKEFDAAVKDELIRDGYLKNDESIKSFQWSDDGSIEINGKAIKKEHEAKYREIHKKHFPKMKGRFHYSE